MIYGNYIIDLDPDRKTPMPHNEIRKALYRQYILQKHGKLGKAVRKEIPQCVMNGIREAWPSSDDMYMGFKEKSIESREGDQSGDSESGDNENYETKHVNN